MEPTVLVATAAADLYGADLQALQSVAAMRGRGWNVVVVTPCDGPLVPRLRTLGASVVNADVPVLRRSAASPAGLLRLLASTPRALVRMRRLITAHRPSVVYVNTITLPWWILAARLAGRPTLCHVHEAERSEPRAVRRALSAPLRFATLCIANSRSTYAELTTMQPTLENRIRLIYNGVPGPQHEIDRAPDAGPTRLLVVGRISARKAPHVAVEALARLLSAGYDVELDICGTAYEPHSAYADELRERCERADVRDRVLLRGHVSPIWPALARSHILVAPSLGESLGNAVIEAQLASRPVVATAAQGHLESVEHQETGLLVPTADPSATAAAVATLIDDRALADRLARNARAAAQRRFSTVEYGHAVTSVIEPFTTTSDRSPVAGARN